MPGVCHELSAQEEVQLYHDADRFGFFSLLIQNEKAKRQFTYPLNRMVEVISGIDQDRDTWITQAEFRRFNRRIVDFARVGLAWVDLDYYNTDHINSPPEKITEQLLMYCSFNGLLPPSMVIYSGRGLQLKWVFDKPIPTQALIRWNALQRFLCQNFLDYGSDPKSCDASRVFRLVNTVNSKSGNRCRVIYHSGETYGFDELCDAYLPVLREVVRENRNNRRPALTLHTNNENRTYANRFNIRTLNWHRLLDLRKLCRMRGWENGVAAGYQDWCLFLATCFLAWSIEPDKLFIEVNTLAREFCPAWKQGEAASACQSAIARAKAAANGKMIEFRGKLKNPRYMFSNKYLIDTLAITGDEQRQLLTIISSEEKKRRRTDKRREQGMVDRQSYLMQSEHRRVEARIRRARGESFRQIAAALSCSPAEIHRLVST
jgi:hypothetical protein